MILRQLTPPYRRYSDWAYWDNGFTPELLKSIEKALKPNSLKPATIGEGSGKIDTDYRPSKVAWIHPNDIFDVCSVIERGLMECAPMVGIHSYVGMCEKLQYTVYEKDDKYDWHTDQCDNNNRTISFVVALSDPEDYRGGRLEIRTQQKPEAVDMPKGRIVYFDSRTLHRVTPVWSGIRKTLVGWIA